MGKVHSITSIIAVIFISVLLFLMIQPMDFLNKNLEGFYHSNEGLIWFIGLILGVLIAWRTYANTAYQNELKKCALEGKEKNDLISTQNEKIIKNQLTYIQQIRQLGKDINENSKRDNETSKILNELTESVQSLHRRIEDSEKKIQLHDLKIEKLTVKVKI